MENVHAESWARSGLETQLHGTSVRLHRKLAAVSLCLKCLKVLQLQLMPSMDVHCFIAYVYSARLDPIGLFVRATLQAFCHDHLFVAFALGKSVLALRR